MARKGRRAAPAASHTGAKGPWAAYAAVGLACAGLGAGGTYLALRPALAQATISRATTAQAARDLGNAYEDRRQWPEAIQAYTQAIAAGLDNPDIRTDLGVAYFKSQQPQKALEQYARAQGENPGHENSLFNEGSAYAVLGDSARAVTTWQQYLQRFPQGQHVAAAKNFIATVQSPGLSAGTPKP